MIKDGAAAREGARQASAAASSAIAPAGAPVIDPDKNPFRNRNVAVARARRRSFDARLETLLTRERIARFQLWQPLLAILLVVAASVLFAAFAVKGAEDESALARAAYEIAKAPLLARTLVYDFMTGKHPRLAVHQRFEGQSGLSIAAGGESKDALLVLSRFDGGQKRGVVELVDLASGKTLHRWRPDARALNARSKLPREIAHLERDFGPGRYLPYHPWPEDDGALVFHGMDSPLVKIDACGAIVWTVDGIFHHGIERDADGDYWVAENVKPATIEHVGDDFQDDAVVRVSAAGEVLFRKSAAQMLIAAGLGHIVYSRDVYDPDPVHLNDVQPALSDGRYWRKGDVFLSFRNPSMIALYRPQTNEMLWTRQGPWSMQHDVDIVSDHEIAVFDNNAVAAPDGETVLKTNDYVIYDFAEDAVRSPFAAGFAAHHVRTHTNGLAELLPDGALMVEEQNFGRLIAFDRTGSERWRYVNRAGDGRVYQLGWSRIVSSERAQRLKAALANADCNN